MKILQVCHKYPLPPKDGGAIAMVSLAEAIAGAGHEISLLAMTTPKHNKGLGKGTENSIYHRIFTEFVDTAINLISLIFNLLFSNKPYNAIRFIDSHFSRRLSKILQQESFDIIQLEGLYLMPYIDEIRRNSNARVVLRAHNIEHEIWKRIARQELNPVKKAYYSIIARRMKAFETDCINLYDLLVPISARDENTFARLGNNKPSKVIPVGINTFSALKSFHVREHPSLFFIGSLDYIPNQEGLMWFVEEVWKKYLLGIKGLNFYVAGRNAPKMLRHYLGAQPLSYMGEVPDARQFMYSCDIMVAPVFSGGGIRVKIIEALALGIPVVCTTPAAEGLDLTDGKNILMADDPELFSAAVVKLLENRTFFANIGKNARLFTEENLDGMLLATELLNFYRNHL